MAKHYDKDVVNKECEGDNDVPVTMSGEKGLCVAVILRSILDLRDDIVLDSSTNKVPKKWQIDRLIWWFENPDTETPFSFLWCCAHADLDPCAILKLIRNKKLLKQTLRDRRRSFEKRFVVYKKASQV